MAEDSDHIIKENTTGSSVRELRWMVTVSVTAGAVTVMVGGRTWTRGEGGGFWTTSNSKGSRPTRSCSCSCGRGPAWSHRNRPVRATMASVMTYRGRRGRRKVQESDECENGDGDEELGDIKGDSSEALLLEWLREPEVYGEYERERTAGSLRLCVGRCIGND